MLSRSLAILVFALCLASPASALRRDAAFGSGSENAFVVVGLFDGEWATTHFLRRVDLESGRFVGRPVVFRNHVGAGINEENRTRRAVLLAQEVQPGHYARVSIQAHMTTLVTPYGSSGYSLSYCFAENAPVYEARAGEIAVFPLDHVVIQGAGRTATIVRMQRGVARTMMMEEFEFARREYPRIEGEAVFVEPTRAARWNQTGDDCAEPDRIDFLPEGAETEWFHEEGFVPPRNTGPVLRKEGDAAGRWPLPPCPRR